MRKFHFKKYKKGIIKIEIKSIIPEKFLNLLWKNKINVRNIKRKDITTVIFEINLKDYEMAKEIAKRTDTKIKIISRRGISFLLIKTRRRQALLGGVVIFIGIIYYLSTFIWNINITTEKNVAPYEIRQQLKEMKISEGVNKRKVNVYDIEDEIIKNNNDIMWVKARIEGAQLNVSIAERQEPPKIIIDNSPCNIVAKKDGEIVRIYTSSGTAIVKNGDVVKKGDVLVKGEQGKEENIYFVHAKADVIARTFYENKKQIPAKYVTRERTGKKCEDIYIKLLNKKIYIKKSKNKFKIYDKIFINKPVIKKEIYYEVCEKPINLNIKDLINKTAKELFYDIIVKLDKSVKIVDKIVDSKLNGDKYQVRVVLVVEENIAESKKIEVNIEDDEKVKSTK